MSDDPNHIGYCGVIIPAAKLWQGYFLDRRLMPVAEALLPGARTKVRTLGAPVRVTVPLADAAEQDMVGAFSGALVEGALVNNDRVVAASAMALHLLTGRPYFVVVGDRLPEGTRTTIETLHAASLAEARALIDNDPRVAAIKRALVDDLKKPRN